MKILTSTTEVIELLGGNIRVGELTGTKPKAVSMWRSWNKFPYRTQMTLTQELRRRRMVAPVELWGMTKKGPIQ